MPSLTPNPFLRRFLTLPLFITTFIAIAAAGILLSGVISNVYTNLFPLALLAGPILYFLIYRGAVKNEVDSISTPPIKAGLFAYFMAGAALIIFYYSAGFYRSEYVFYLTFVMYVMTLILVWFKPTPFFALTLLCLTGYLNRITAYYASALYPPGNDYYAHLPWVTDIMTEGSLSPLHGDKYFYAPFYHLHTGTVSEITSFEVQHAAALVTPVLFTVVPVLVIYALVRWMWSERTASVAAFLFMASDYAIYHGHYAVTTSVAVVLFSLILLMIYRYHQNPERLTILLAIILLCALSLTHQVGLFITVVFIFAYFTVRLVYEGRLNGRVVVLPLYSGVVLFTDFMITRRSGPMGERTFLEAYLGLIIRRLPAAGTSSRQETSLPSDPAFTGIGAVGLDPVQLIGMVALISLAVTGTLYYLFSTGSQRYEFAALAFGIPISVMYAIALGLPIIGIGDLLPTRWFPFIYILLSILAAPVVARIFKYPTFSSGGYRLHGMILLLVIFSLPFVVVMSGNHVGASDNPFLDDASGAERFGVTETEKALFDYSVIYAPNDELITDRRASSVYAGYYNRDTNVVNVVYDDPMPILQSGLLVNREYIHTVHAQYILKYEDTEQPVSGPIPVHDIDPTKHALVYNNGSDKLSQINK